MKIIAFEEKGLTCLGVMRGNEAFLPLVEILPEFPTDLIKNS